MRANIKLMLSKLTPMMLLALIRRVILHLTGNIYFPTPKVKLVDMTAKADALSAAIDAAVHGSRQDRLLRDALVEQVRDMLRVQADYIRTESDGDEVKLGSSGFDLSKQREPIGVLPAPAKFVALVTNIAGTVSLRWGGVHGADQYQVYMSLDPAGDKWETVGITSKNRFMVEGLESGKQYFFKVAAMGSEGEGSLSELVDRRAA